MTNVAFIPVRGGSKSIPLKNIREINGKPLVYWTTKAASDAKCIDKVVIATDNEQIKQTVISFGLDKIEIYDRDAENADDTSSTESVMLEYLNKSDLKADDKFFLIQATSPMLRTENIEGIYAEYLQNDFDSMFTGVIEKQFHWYRVQGHTPKLNKERTLNTHNSYLAVEPVNYDYRNRPRRQDFEGLVAENGACYINTVENILRDKCRLSGKIGAYELPAYTAYEIDEKIDWIIVETLMRNFGY